MIYLMTSDSWLDILRSLWAIKPYGPMFIVFGTIMVLFFLIVFILAFKGMTQKPTGYVPDSGGVTS